MQNIDNYKPQMEVSEVQPDQDKDSPIDLDETVQQLLDFYKRWSNSSNKHH